MAPSGFVAIINLILVLTAVRVMARKIHHARVLEPRQDSDCEDILGDYCEDEIDMVTIMNLRNSTFSAQQIIDFYDSILDVICGVTCQDNFKRYYTCLGSLESLDQICEKQGDDYCFSIYLEGLIHDVVKNEDETSCRQDFTSNCTRECHSELVNATTRLGCCSNSIIDNGWTFKKEYLTYCNVTVDPMDECSSSSTVKPLLLITLASAVVSVIASLVLALHI